MADEHECRRIMNVVGPAGLEPATRPLCAQHRLHTTNTVGLPHARERGELCDGFA
jgi:hypothetical protein